MDLLLRLDSWTIANPFLSQILTGLSVVVVVAIASKLTALLVERTEPRRALGRYLARRAALRARTELLIRVRALIGPLGLIESGQRTLFHTLFDAVFAGALMGGWTAGLLASSAPWSRRLVTIVFTLLLLFLARRIDRRLTLQSRIYHDQDIVDVCCLQGHNVRAMRLAKLAVLANELRALGLDEEEDTVERFLRILVPAVYEPDAHAVTPPPPKRP